MKRLILALLVTQSAFALTSSTRPVKGDFMESMASWRNFAPNPSAIRNTTGWTTSSVTVLRDTDAGDAFDGMASFLLQSATNPATFCTADIALPDPYEDGVNGEVAVYFKNDASKWQLELRSSGGSTVLADVDLTNSTTWAKASFNYPMADNYRICVSSNAASPASINVAGFYWGPATNLTEVAQAEALVKAGRVTTNQTISTTSPTTLIYNEENLDVYAEYDGTTGVYTAKRAGRYVVSAAAAYSSTTANELYYIRADKNNADADCQGAGYWNAVFTDVQLVGCIVELSAGDTIRFKGISTADTSYDFAVSSNSYMTITRFPSSSEIAVRPDQSGFFWYGYHAQNCSWARTNTSAGDPTADASCTFTQLQNFNAGTVASYDSGGSLPGVTFTPPRAGLYEVCANGTMNNGTTGNTAFVGLYDVTGAAAMTDQNNWSDNSGVSRTFALCGTVNASGNTARSVTLRTAASAGTVTIATVTGITAVAWTIRAISMTQPAPLLVGSVTSNSSGLERVERASVSCTGAASVVSQSGSWLTLGNRSGGTCAMTLASGIFSATPACVASYKGGGTAPAIATNMTSATAGNLNFSSSVDFTADIICMGPR